MQKPHFIRHEANIQGKRVCGIENDFRYTFNAMSQAALWRVMNLFDTGLMGLRASGM